MNPTPNTAKHPSLLRSAVGFAVVAGIMAANMGLFLASRGPVADAPVMNVPLMGIMLSIVLGMLTLAYLTVTYAFFWIGDFAYDLRATRMECIVPNRTRRNYYRYATVAGGWCLLLFLFFSLNADPAFAFGILLYALGMVGYLLLIWALPFAIFCWAIHYVARFFWLLRQPQKKFTPPAA